MCSKFGLRDATIGKSSTTARIQPICFSAEDRRRNFWNYGALTEEQADILSRHAISDSWYYNRAIYNLRVALFDDSGFPAQRTQPIGAVRYRRLLTWQI